MNSMETFTSTAVFVTNSKNIIVINMNQNNWISLCFRFVLNAKPITLLCILFVVVELVYTMAVTIQYKNSLYGGKSTRIHIYSEMMFIFAVITTFIMSASVINVGLHMVSIF